MRGLVAFASLFGCLALPALAQHGAGARGGGFGGGGRGFGGGGVAPHPAGGMRSGGFGVGLGSRGGFSGRFAGNMPAPGNRTALPADVRPGFGTGTRIGGFAPGRVPSGTAGPHRNAGAFAQPGVSAARPAFFNRFGPSGAAAHGAGPLGPDRGRGGLNGAPVVSYGRTGNGRTGDGRAGNGRARNTQFGYGRYGYGRAGYRGFGYPVFVGWNFLDLDFLDWDDLGWRGPGWGDGGSGFAAQPEAYAAQGYPAQNFAGQCGTAPDVSAQSPTGDPAPAQAPDSLPYGDSAASAPTPLLPEAYGRPAQPAQERALTLIFKDGRAPVQVRNYALTRRTLFVFGSQTREIPVDTLDVPATQAVNRQSGLDFELP